MSLTPEDIKDLRAAEAKMAPGPWKPYTRTIIAGDGWTGWALIPDVEAGDERIVCEGEPNDTDGIVALRNAAPALLDAADGLATLRLEHESWGAIIDGLRATVAEMKAQRDADVMTALMRQSEVFDVTLATVTRDRDELRAALLNERGEGTGPSEGWARNDFDRRAVGIAWYRPSNADGSPPPAGAMDYAYVLWVYREPTEPEWTWECEHADFSSRNIQGKAPTAREAMRAADTALAGAKS